MDDPLYYIVLLMNYKVYTILNEIGIAIHIYNLSLLSQMYNMAQNNCYAVLYTDSDYGLLRLPN